MYATKNTGSRHCFRCSLPLTDAASLNEGIGPICRKLDNSVLARLIPSDMAKVLAAYRTVDVLSLTPETLDTFMALEAAFRADDAATREDWRKEVKRIEWILSHHQTYQNIEALKSVVLGLGYVGIVSLWSGEAATGLASVLAVDGRLFFQGPQNKAGRIAFKKIYGFKFHPASSDFPKACWSFPADKFREVRLAIITHYPNFSGLLEAVEAAQVLVEEQKAAAAAAAEVAKVNAEEKKAMAIQAGMMAAAEVGPSDAGALAKAALSAVNKTLAEPIISLVEVGDTLKVKTPFRTSYIAELRSTPKDTLPRKWNAEEKVWEFPVSHKAKVEALVQKHYGWH